MVNGQTQARHNAQMLGDITSVGSVPCAPASKFAFSLVQGGAIKPVRQKTPLEIILRAEELRNLPGLFETGAAAGPYTSRWSQAIGILHFGAVSTSFAITSPLLSIWHIPVYCSWLLAVQMPEYRRSLSFSSFRKDDQLFSPLSSQSEHPLIHFR